MLEHLNEWGPLLIILVSLGGLIITAAGIQITLYLGLRADLRAQSNRIANLADNLAAVHTELSQRLARVEAKLNIPLAD